MSYDIDIADKEWSAGYDQARSDIAAGRQIIEGMVCIHRAQLEAYQGVQTAAQNAWELLRYQPRKLPDESETAAKLLEHALAAPPPDIKAPPPFSTDELNDCYQTSQYKGALPPDEIAGLIEILSEFPASSSPCKAATALRTLAAEVEELKAVRDAQADELKEVDQLDCSKRIRELEAEQLKMGALRHQLEICENERAKYRAERDDWKQCAEVEAKVRREFNEMLKKAESEREQHLADMHGMQDGSLLRDTRAENERLKAEIRRKTIEQHLADLDGMQDGSLVRDLRAENERLKAERDKLAEENLDAQMGLGALDAIHELLDSGGVPRGTFADDHVRNLVAMHNNVKAERDAAKDQLCKANALVEYYKAERDAIRRKTIEEIILMMVKARTWDAFEIELRALAEPESEGK